MNTIEQQLWDYIDGNLDVQQALTIKGKINSDEDVKLLYEELLKTNLALSSLELDEPSMSFTRNVMESIVTAPAPITLKTKVNIHIIYGISGFFIVLILALIGFALSGLDVKNAGLDVKFDVVLNFDQYITPTLIYTFLFVDLIIGLVFLDYLLRKRLIRK